MRIQDDILKSLDSHKYVILVLLDLSSAFDSVDHDILMNKLYKIGVRGRAYSPWARQNIGTTQGGKTSMVHIYLLGQYKLRNM